VRRLPCAAEAQAGRLLRVLFLRHGALSTDPGAWAGALLLTSAVSSSLPATTIVRSNTEESALAVRRLLGRNGQRRKRAGRQRHFLGFNRSSLPWASYATNAGSHSATRIRIIGGVLAEVACHVAP